MARRNSSTLVLLRIALADATAKPLPLTNCVKHIYDRMMHTVCELHSFRRAVDECGMTAVEVRGLIDTLALNPKAGDEMAGTGGCRKLRVAGRGKGKSGGYRVISFYTGDAMPVFLITVFSKGERANLSKADQNKLAGIAADIVTEYQNRVVKVSG